MQEITTIANHIRVGVVDDHITMANGLAKLLDDMPGIKCVFEAYNGQEVLRVLKQEKNHPDILLMDVDMPGTNGIDATREISSLYPVIKVIALSGFYDELTIQQMIAAGACAFLPKEIRTIKLNETIHKVHNNEKYHADLHYLYGENFGRVKVEAARILFTDNEKLFLQLLVAGYDYQDIGIQMQVSRNTVKYYKACVDEKFNTTNRITIVVEALRLGLVKI